MHALPAPAAPRRFALPGLLLGLAVVTLGGLAVLPAATPVHDVLVAQSVVVSPADLTAAETLERPRILPRVVVKAAPKKAPVVAAKKPAPRPVVKRASRSTRTVIAAEGGGYTCPVAGRVSFTDTWGDRRSGGRGHQGTDMMAAYGTPLVAVTSGVVKTAYSSAGGISLYLRGTDGVEYFYAHNSRNAASNGERVAAGEVIAYVGSSGNASAGAPHLHFERHLSGRAVNPYMFLVRACR